MTSIVFHRTPISGVFLKRDSSILMLPYMYLQIHQEHKWNLHN